MQRSNLEIKSYARQGSAAASAIKPDLGKSRVRFPEGQLPGDPGLPDKSTLRLRMKGGACYDKMGAHGKHPQSAPGMFLEPF